jgi:hypothetical protein
MTSLIDKMMHGQPENKAAKPLMGFAVVISSAN